MKKTTSFLGTIEDIGIWNRKLTMKERNILYLTIVIRRGSFERSIAEPTTEEEAKFNRMINRSL